MLLEERLLTLESLKNFLKFCLSYCLVIKLWEMQSISLRMEISRVFLKVDVGLKQKKICYQNKGPFILVKSEHITTIWIVYMIDSMK